MFREIVEAAERKSIKIHTENMYGFIVGVFFHTDEFYRFFAQMARQQQVLSRFHLGVFILYLFVKNDFCKIYIFVFSCDGIQC